MLAHRGKAELGIEGGDTQNLSGGQAGTLGDMIDCIDGNVAVDLLGFLQYGNEAALDVGILIQHVLQQGQIHTFVIAAHCFHSLLFLEFGALWT